MVTGEHVIETMRGYVIEAAQPGEPGESRKAMLRRAARRLGLSVRRAAALFYREARTVTAQELLNAEIKITNHRKRMKSRLRRELATIEKIEADYAKERARFLQDHPLLGRLAPPARSALADPPEADED